MKTIQTILAALFAAALLSSCETTASVDKSFKYPEPEYARTSTELQETHGRLLRQYY